MISPNNRVLRLEEVTPHEDPAFVTKWDEFNSPAKVEESLARLKEFAEIIRLEAVKLLDEEYELSHLHFSAFQGPIGGSSGVKQNG